MDSITVVAQITGHMKFFKITRSEGVQVVVAVAGIAVVVYFTACGQVFEKKSRVIGFGSKTVEGHIQQGHAF